MSLLHSTEICEPDKYYSKLLSIEVQFIADRDPAWKRSTLYPVARVTEVNGSNNAASLLSQSIETKFHSHKITMLTKCQQMSIVTDALQNSVRVPHSRAKAQRSVMQTSITITNS